MTREEFFEKLSDFLEVDAALTGTERLQELENWDSVMAVGFMALADDSCGVMVAPRDLAGCKTVNDLVALVSEKFDRGDLQAQ